MEDCYNNLRAKSLSRSLCRAQSLNILNADYTFEKSRESVSYPNDDEARRREEEELQRVLEMSVRDKGGRSHWQEQSTFGGTSSSNAAASGSGSSSSFFGKNGSISATGSQSSTQPIKQTTSPAEQPPFNAPSRSASVTSTTTQSATNTSQAVNMIEQDPAVLSTQVNPAVNRVRALFTFQPTDAGELAFEKGDIIKVVDRVYKDWWRGQLKGRTGIFPVNHVVSVYLLLRVTVTNRICRSLCRSRRLLKLRKKQSRKRPCFLRLRPSTIC
jgi:signal transducing adaptor molecule